MVIKLLSFWLAWLAIRLITATAVVIGAVALMELLVNGQAGAAARAAARLTQLRGATHQLERTIEKALKRASSRCPMGPWDQSFSVHGCSASALPTRKRLPTDSPSSSATTRDCLPRTTTRRSCAPLACLDVKPGRDADDRLHMRAVVCLPGAVEDFLCRRSARRRCVAEILKRSSARSAFTTDTGVGPGDPSVSPGRVEAARCVPFA